MNLAHAPFALLLLAPLCFAPAGNTPSFGVAKGTKLTKHFETTIDLDKQDASITVDGNDLPPNLVKQIEITFAFKNVIEVEDEYAEIEGARAQKLVRTYHKATQGSKQHIQMLGQKAQDKDQDLVSPLVDHTVAFSWNAKDEKYERAFEGDKGGEKGDDKWLEKLDQDMDFLHLLPEGELAVDQTWKIEPQYFDALTLPGGKLSFEIKKKTDTIDFSKNLTGEIEAKYTGTREVDGHTFGVIALSAKLATKHETEEGAGPPMKMAIHFELEGEYLWDLAAKHLRSFEIHGPVAMEMKGEREVEAKGQKMPMKLNFDLAGEMKVKGEFGD